MEEIVKGVALATLNIDESQYSEDLAAGDVVQWDSVGHLRLLMAVEEKFGITFDIGDAIDIETIGDIIETVRRYQ